MKPLETLVELLMALVVVGIMTAIVLPAMRVHLANADIRGVAEEMRSGLELARTEAIRRNASVQFQRTGTAWTVVLPGADNGADLVVAKRETRQAQVSVDADTNNISFNGPGWTSPFGQAMNIVSGRLFFRKLLSVLWPLTRAARYAVELRNWRGALDRKVTCPDLVHQAGSGGVA